MLRSALGSVVVVMLRGGYDGETTVSGSTRKAVSARSTRRTRRNLANLSVQSLMQVTSDQIGGMLTFSIDTGVSSD